MIYPDATRTVGRTPMVELARCGRGLPARLLGKLEMRNPCGSVKDRPGILMGDALARARELVERTPGSIMLDQFTNAANAEMHRQTTGPEIWSDTEGAVDVFVSAVGTGGTITGVGEFLKTRKPDARIVAVEPATCALISGGKPGPHRIRSRNPEPRDPG